MSSDWVEVITYWKISIRKDAPYTFSIWIPMTLTKEIVDTVEDMGGTIYRTLGIISFDSIEDIVVFRMRIGV